MSALNNRPASNGEIMPPNRRHPAAAARLIRRRLDERPGKQFGEGGIGEIGRTPTRKAPRLHQDFGRKHRPAPDRGRWRPHGRWDCRTAPRPDHPRPSRTPVPPSFIWSRSSIANSFGKQSRTRSRRCRAREYNATMAIMKLSISQAPNNRSEARHDRSLHAPRDHLSPGGICGGAPPTARYSPGRVLINQQKAAAHRMSGIKSHPA